MKSVHFQGLIIDNTATDTSATTKTTPLEEIKIVFKKGTMVQVIDRTYKRLNCTIKSDLSAGSKNAVMYCDRILARNEEKWKCSRSFVML